MVGVLVLWECVCVCMRVVFLLWYVYACGVGGVCVVVCMWVCVCVLGQEGV